MEGFANFSQFRVQRCTPGEHAPNQGHAKSGTVPNPVARKCKGKKACVLKKKKKLPLEKVNKKLGIKEWSEKL